MRIAYFGIDALSGCLEHLLKTGHTVVRVFTTAGDRYDRTEKIRAIAAAHGVPVLTTRATKEDVEALAAAKVELSVTAGYPCKIPVTDAFMQVNLHPAYLPKGRGPWPMPVAILRGEGSGVTLHKLSDEFDAGDILLQTPIPLEERETLVTLTDKIGRAAVKLLAEFLESPRSIWEAAQKQGEGEYWPEPDDADRTIRPSSDAADISLKRRAFEGYGCLYLHGGLPWETEFTGERPVITQPYFRELRLSDRAAMERIRRRYLPALSDYTFALLWCWRRPMRLSVCLGEDLFAVKGDGYYFFPVGAPELVIAFLRELRKRERVTLRFCDERAKAMIDSAFPGAQCRYAEDDSDYLIENRTLKTLAGGEFLRRRNDLHHYLSLTPPPRTEPITRENLREVALLSEICRRNGSADAEAEQEALRYFFELGLEGILVRRGERPVGFAVRSEKDEETVQGHFSKCAERIRGGALYAIKSCSDEVADRYPFTDLEDDLGDEGLRRFKRSLKPRIVASYTVTLEQL